MSVRRVLLSLMVCAACGDDAAGSASDSAGSTGAATTTTGEAPTTSGPPTTSDGEATAGETTGAGVCVPGEALGCACPGEQFGQMVCADDGSGFGECVCPNAVCGDGDVDAGEVCDDGVNDGGYGGCLADCSAPGPSCGDAVVNGPEACDDGDAVDGDGCNVDCVQSGSELWTEYYGGEDAGNARARGVAIDPSGNVVVVGQEFVVGQNANVWVRKYTPDGDVLWSRAWDGPSSGDDIAHAVAIDQANGEIVLTGEQYQAGEGADIFVARLAPDGETMWQITNPGNGFGDVGLGVAIDPEGKIAVTGSEYKGIGLDNVWTRLMQSDGAEIWTDVFDANLGNDRGNAVAFNLDGDVVVAGSIYVPIGLADLWLRKYSKADGKVIWTRSSDHMAGNDMWHAIAIDSDGEIGLVGEVYEVAGLSAIIAAKYNASGSKLWINYQDSDGGDNDIGHGVAFSADGSLVAVGEEYTANDFARAWVRKYDSTGAELWTQIHDGQDSGNDIAWAVAVDAAGHVYAAGEEYAVGQFAEVWLRKFAP
ncbi:MAG: hypothetical protein JNL82_35255 [Myxococcales bacterium]|nr:hypothetical protein [Myxococcales bacterium]